MKTEGGPAAAERLFSRALTIAWAIPTTLLLLPFASFQSVDQGWMFAALVSAGFAILATRVAERRLTPTGPRQSSEALLRATAAFSFLAGAGSLLILQDQQSGLSGLGIENLQEKYIALTERSLAGESGGPLSTIGNILRASLPVALTAACLFTAGSAPAGRKILVTALALSAAYLNAVATASRTQLIFTILVVSFTCVSIRHPLFRSKRVLLAIGGALFLYLVGTMAQRMNSQFEDTALASDYVPAFFDAELQSLGLFVAEQAGVPAVATAFYLAHSVPELSKLVADGSTSWAMGTHSFFLVLNPFARMLGIEFGGGNILADRQGMWWGMMGDLYLDFGPLFLIFYPGVAYILVRTAMRLANRSLYGEALKAVTVSMLFSSPFFGVLNSFSFTYAVSLALAILSPRVIALQPPSEQGGSRATR